MEKFVAKGKKAVEFTNFYMHENQRGKGIGTKLFGELENKIQILFPVALGKEQTKHLTALGDLVIK